jgi:protein TonB
MVDTPQRKRDPILDPPPKQNNAVAWGAGVGFASTMLLGIGYYFYSAEFALPEFKYEDNKVDVDLVAPPPPPPPTPPPPPPPPK